MTVTRGAWRRGRPIFMNAVYARNTASLAARSGAAGTRSTARRFRAAARVGLRYIFPPSGWGLEEAITDALAPFTFPLWRPHTPVPYGWLRLRRTVPRAVEWCPPNRTAWHIASHVDEREDCLGAY